MKTALKSKNKLGFIDGSIQRPTVKKEEYSAELNAQKMVNSMVISWILNVLDPKMHASVAYVDSAHKMWENIHKPYSVSNVPRIHQLKAEIASSKQGNMDVVDFFSKLMSLWIELDNYVKRPMCTCKATEEFMKLIADDKAHQFLMGLDDDLYSTIRSQILAMDSFPSLDRMFIMVRQEETHKRMMSR